MAIDRVYQLRMRIWKDEIIISAWSRMHFLELFKSSALYSIELRAFEISAFKDVRCFDWSHNESLKWTSPVQFSELQFYISYNRLLSGDLIYISQRCRIWFLPAGKIYLKIWQLFGFSPAWLLFLFQHLKWKLFVVKGLISIMLFVSICSVILV